MRELKFTIPGAPVGKGRPRFTRTHHGVRAYKPEKTASYENLVKLYAQQAIAELPDGWALPGQAGIRVEAVFLAPQSKPKAWHELAKTNKIRPVAKPDLDNVLKIICDALTGITYRDDACVVRADITKIFGAVPMTRVTVIDMTDPNDKWSK